MSKIKEFFSSFVSFLILLILLASFAYTVVSDVKKDIKEVRENTADLRERMVRVETLLEQLLKQEGLVKND